MYDSELVKKQCRQVVLVNEDGETLTVEQLETLLHLGIDQLIKEIKEDEAKK